MITSTHILTDSDICLNSLSQNSHQTIQNDASKLSFRSNQEKCSRLKNIINNLYKKGLMEIITKTPYQVHNENTITIDFICEEEIMENYTMTDAFEKIEIISKNQERLETDSLTVSVKKFILNNYTDKLNVCIDNKKFRCLSSLEISFDLLDVNKNYFNDFIVHFVNNVTCNKLSTTKKKLVNSLLPSQYYLEPEKKNILGSSWFFSSHKTSDNLLLLTSVAINKDFCSKNNFLMNKIYENFACLEFKVLHKEMLKSLVIKIINELSLRNEEKKFLKKKSSKCIHFSMPIGKVESVLPNCQLLKNISTSSLKKSICKTHLSSHSHNNPINKINKEIRISNILKTKFLCLYCEQKFTSDSLQQQHTEKAHFFPSKRRLRHNSKKFNQQKCRYCTNNKFWDNLDNLFQHLVRSHDDKYFGCLHCKTRYHTKKALISHNYKMHYKIQYKQRRKQNNIKNEIIHHKLIMKLLKSNTNFKNKSAAEKISLVSYFDASQIFYKSISRNVHGNFQYHFDDKHSSNFFFDKQLVLISNVEKQKRSQNSFGIPSPVIAKKLYVPVFYIHHLRLSNDSEHSGKFMVNFSRSNFLTTLLLRQCLYRKYQFSRKNVSQEEYKYSPMDFSKFDLYTQNILKKKQCSSKNFSSSFNKRNQSMSLQVVSKDDCKKKNFQENLIDKAVCTNSDNIDFITTQLLLINLKNKSYQSNFMKNEKSHSGVYSNVQKKKISSVSNFEFQNLMKLDILNASCFNEKETAHFSAELSGEWSRPKTYVCSVCEAKYIHLYELEKHKSIDHTNVLCCHYEFSGNQRDLYQHLNFLSTHQNTIVSKINLQFINGCSVKTRQQIINSYPPEKKCTKCSKISSSFSEFHKHILECGNDQAWLSGLFRNHKKKKSKWRPFGSKSRKRKQRGLKRSIYNCQVHRDNFSSSQKLSIHRSRFRPNNRKYINKELDVLLENKVKRKFQHENTQNCQRKEKSAPDIKWLPK